MHTGKLGGRLLLIFVVLIGTILLYSGITGIVRTEYEAIMSVKNEE